METLFTEIESFLDKEAIKQLVVKYFRAIDDKCGDIEIIRNLFTGNAFIKNANGNILEGLQQIFDSYHHNVDSFQSSQHTISDFIINTAFDMASIRANTIAMHKWSNSSGNNERSGKSLYSGIVLTGRAIKIKDKWKLSELNFRNVWSGGKTILQMGEFLNRQSA